MFTLRSQHKHKTLSNYATGILLCSNLPPHTCVPTKSKGEKNYNYNKILHTLENARLALLISSG